MLQHQLIAVVDLCDNLVCCIASAVRVAAHCTCWENADWVKGCVLQTQGLVQGDGYKVWAVWVWCYCILWWFVQDIFKVNVYPACPACFLLQLLAPPPPLTASMHTACSKQ